MGRKHFPWLYGAALLVGANLAAAPADAGVFRVSPVSLDLSGGQGAATLILRNDDDEAMNIQIRVFRWTQEGDRDELVPTNEVVVSPPLAPLAAHSERTLRVVRLAPQAAEEEASYRLVIDELPRAPDSGQPQVRLLMRHSIPLFFSASPRQAKVAWELRRGDDGLTLSASNAGGRRLRLSNLRVLDGKGQVMEQTEGLVGYVLAGRHMRWTLPSARSDVEPKRLVADSDSGPVDVAISPTS